MNKKVHEQVPDHNLIAQYRVLISDAVMESESQHKTSLNISKLQSKLRVILKAAQYDGIHENTISQLIEEAIPFTKAA